MVFPGRVAADCLGCAVVVGHGDLQQEGEPFAVHVALACESQETAIPTVAQRDADGVGALPQQVRDIVCLVLEAGVVGRPAGGE